MYYLQKEEKRFTSPSVSETIRECKAPPSLCIFLRRGDPPHCIPLRGRISPSRHCIFIKQEESLHYICCRMEDAPHCMFCRMGDISPLYLLQKERCSLLHFPLGGRSFPSHFAQELRISQMDFLHKHKRFSRHLLQDEECFHYIFFTREESGPLYFR